MPWWAWLLIGWCAVAAVCAFWFGSALWNAEIRDQRRQAHRSVGEDEPPVEDELAS